MSDMVMDFSPTESVDVEDGDESKRYGDKRAPIGPLMRPYKPGSEDEKRVAKSHLLLWTQQDRFLSRATAQWGVNAARRAGITNAMLRPPGRYTNDEHWTAFIPRGATADTTPDTNKAATLCRRMVSQLTVDPFVAEVSVVDGDDGDRDSVELSQRVLHGLQDEHELDEVEAQREAIDRRLTYGSGYIEYYIDQRGGGSRPVEVEARADALTAGLALIDPLTGMEGPEIGPDGQPMPFAKRMVAEDGSFVEREEDAAIEYLPKLRRQVMDSRHVRLVPHTCSGIGQADGVLIAAMPTWGEVKRMSPGIEKLDDEAIEEILGFRPKFVDTLTTLDSAEIPHKVDGKWNDERLVFVLKSYHKRSPSYPDGCFLITVGGCYVMHRSVWVDQSDGKKRPLSLPVSQSKGLREGREGYWYVGLMEIIGGGNETRTAQMASWLDHLDRFGRRKTFLPTNSLINPDQLDNPRATVLPVNPGGEPYHEPVPDFPADFYAIREEAGRDMDDAAGLRATSGPEAKSNVKSGRHEFALISESHAGLAEDRQNYEASYIRSSRITLELARAFLTEEQQTRYSPDGGEYRVQAWRGADLVENPVVRVKPGSGTMLAPAAKAQLAERYAGMGILPADDLADVVTSNIGPTIGLLDNPHRLRVNSQIAEWREGPPDGWQPQGPPNPQGQPTTVVPGQPDPATGQPGPPQIVDPVLAQIFEPIMADALPPVAAMRLKQIADAMAGPKYRAFPPPWRAGLDAAYQMAGMAMQSQPEPEGEARSAKDENESGLVNRDGTPPNDLQEDALQQGAPPEMVI